MRTKLITLLFISGIIAAASRGANALTATEIIKKSEEAVRGDSTISRVEITIKTRRWTRTLKMKSWEYRINRKSFSEIYAPAKDAGNRFLLIGQKMWHYVPKLQQTIKISPSMMLQSWMGSDFTNDDIVKESSIIWDYYHKKGGTSTIDGFACNRIILTPKPDAAVVWGKIVYYARQSDHLPVKEEFYNEHGKLKKVMTCSEFREMGDRIIPTLYKMVTVGKRNQFTLFRINYARFNTPIPNRTFSLQNLTRR